MMEDLLFPPEPWDVVSTSSSMDPDEQAESQGMIPVLTPAEATADMLKTYSHNFLITIINNKDFDSPLWDRMDPDFIGSIEGFGIARGAKAYKELVRECWKALPNYRSDIINSAAEVDEANGKATVWFTVKQGGFPGGLTRETIGQVTWKRKRAGWVCLKYTGLDWSGLLPAAQDTVDG